MRHISHFCEKGGLELFHKIIETTDISEAREGFNLCVLAILISLVSLPAAVYHKKVMEEYAPRLIECAQKRLLSAPDKALRVVKREHVEAIVKAIDSFARRTLEKDERERRSEILSLEVTLLCLNSAFMERKLQGIKQLNQIIKNSKI